MQTRCIQTIWWTSMNEALTIATSTTHRYFQIKETTHNKSEHCTPSTAVSAALKKVWTHPHTGRVTTPPKTIKSHNRSYMRTETNLTNHWTWRQTASSKRIRRITSWGQRSTGQLKRGSCTRDTAAKIGLLRRWEVSRLRSGKCRTMSSFTHWTSHRQVMAPTREFNSSI